MSNLEQVKKSLRRRYFKERVFRFIGLGAIAVSIYFLCYLLVDISHKAWPAFTHTEVTLPVDLSTEPDSMTGAGIDSTQRLKQALLAQLTDVQTTQQAAQAVQLLSSHAPFRLDQYIEKNHDLLGQRHAFSFLLSQQAHEQFRRMKKNPGSLSQEQQWLQQLDQAGWLNTRFNVWFFTQGDSREAEQAGIYGALKGSFFTILVALFLSFPVALGAAIYLEEFAPQNRFIHFIEVNINNLAAVPSVIFGLLGLAVFINVFHFPRSAPLLAGLVLSLMTLPTIIIASRSALKAVPLSIREAALALGVSKVQMVFHHVVPTALPGVMTGSIIGMAQALGETAPLLMIGMVAFIADPPQSVVDPATALPVQIFLWADSPEPGYLAKASAAILVLLAFLMLVNAFSIYLRKRFERKW